MKVDYNKFLEWIKAHFSDYIERNGKILLNSVFCDDHKYHLSCKPEIGFYICYKSGKKNTLYHLISVVEHCSEEEAKQILGDNCCLYDLEEKLAKLFDNDFEDQPIFTTSILPSGVFLIKDLIKDNHFRIKAENYVASRHLPVGNLMVGIAGKLTNRIVIPYYCPQGELVYFNARDLTGKATLRYRGPEKGIGKDKNEVLWTKFWPPNGTKIYLTEGEFDAMSLNECGFHGMACGGKELYEKQITLIRKYKIAISFDTDISGKDALIKVGKKLRSLGLTNISYIRPAVGYKDWNEMLVKFDKNILSSYIRNEEKLFDDWTSISLKLN